MSLNGCTFVKLLKAEGMEKVHFFALKKKEGSLRMATPPLRFSFQIRLSGARCHPKLLLQAEPLFGIQIFDPPQWLYACWLPQGP